MVTLLSRFSVRIIIAIVAIVLLLGFVYNKGYQDSNIRCEIERNELIQSKEREKNEILSKIREKSTVARRNELKRYVIK